MAREGVAVAILVAVCATGCGMRASGTADGPRKRICGEWIGRAEESIGSGPWYVDASAGNPATISAAAGSSGTWVRVSGNCARGARVSISDPAVVRVIGVVPAKNGTDVAVLVNPGSAGRRADRDYAGHVRNGQ